MDEPKAGKISPSGSVTSATAPPCDNPTPPPFDRSARNAQQRRRVEITSTGIDESLQGIGSDPYGSIAWVGLRIPTLKNTAATRYLAQLAAFTVNEGQRARIIGFRHGYSIGYMQSNPTYLNEFWVRSPVWKMQDGNVSWHLRKMALGYPFPPSPGPIVPPMANFAFRTSDTPAILYQAAAGFAGGFYTTLAAYTPPNRGMPWGDPIGASLGTFHDLKTDWRDGGDWHSVDLPIEGPQRVAFYASVLQSGGTGGSPRHLLSMPVSAVTPPNTVLNFSEGLEPEEQFLQNFPNAIIWRVAGSLLVELEDNRP